MTSFQQVFVNIALIMWISTVDSNMVDMGYEYSNETVHWPGDMPFNLDVVYIGEYGDHWYEINNYGANEHVGTHVDAPAHFTQGKRHVNDIPLKDLIGPAVVIDISERAEADPDAQLLVNDLEAYEDKHGSFPAGAILLMNSGWDRHYNDREAYLGSDDGTANNLHFPGIHQDAARWIVANGNIRGVGVDTPSLDKGTSTLFESHQILLAGNIYGIENVKNTGLIPVRGATLYVMPMKIKDGSGGPARIVAIWDTSTNSASYLYYITYHFSTLYILFGISTSYCAEYDFMFCLN